MTKLTKFIFLLLLLFLPTQLGKHYWFSFSYVFGQRIDYLSPTVYLTDVLIALLFLLEIKEVFSLLKRKLIFFLPFCFIVLFLSYYWLTFQNHLLGLLIYKWIKLLEFLFLIFWVKTRVKINQIYLPLSFGVIWESILVILQFFHQRSLGLWLLGERHFNVVTPGIALADWRESLVLRPYGTFSHPNVMAGYVLVILIFNLWAEKLPRSWRVLTLLLGILTLFLSFSQGAWLAGIFIFSLWLWQKREKRFLSPLFFLSPFSQETIWQRLDLTWASWQMVKRAPIFGVGLGNFIPQLPQYLIPQKIYFWQPVHNIFLLVLAQLGMVGLGLILALVRLILKRLWLKKNFILFYSFLAVIITGFFDHYWLTLPQTQLLLALMIGLALQKYRE